MDFVIEEDIKVTLVSRGEISPVLEVILDSNVYILELGKTISLPQKKALVRMRDPLINPTTVKAKACDHTPYYMCIFFLASLCIYFILSDRQRFANCQFTK